MRSKSKKGSPLVFLAILLASACIAACKSGDGHKAGGREGLLAFATIPPHAYLARRIGGGLLDVETMIPAGASPHSFEPTPRRIAGVASADIYFTAGVEAEKGFLPKIRRLKPGLEMVDLNRGIRQDASDPHTWLSPRLFAIQARNVYDVLAHADVSHRSEYRKNLEALLADLGKLDRDLAHALKPVRGRTLYVFHPSLGYFARAYGIKQVAVEVEGKEPGARQLAELIERAKGDGIKVIFAEPQFSKKSAEVIAKAIGGKVVEIDPLAQDYPENMRTISGRVAEALKGEGAER